MTLVLDLPGEGPRVHVLAVGVGGYRYLPGGADWNSRRTTLGLTQLTGPPLSALAFVDFVRRRLRHPRARLGTVELLLSPAQSWQTTPVDVPSMDNVLRAFDAWYERCDRREEVGLFFFCGHGVQRESPFLLLEDFGAAPNRLFENAVDISLTVASMAACAAGTQYFFADACREVPQELLERHTGTARVLTDRPVYGEDRDCALLFASSGGRRAYGLPRRPTRFTQALIDAWGGLGAHQDGSGWVVDFGGMQSAITSLLRREDPAAPHQVPQGAYVSGNPALQVCAEPPVVPLTLTCVPPEALGGAGLTTTLTQVGSSAAVALSSVESGWTATVPADVYQFEVGIDPPYRPAVQRIAAWPPYCDVPVTVSP